MSESNRASAPARELPNRDEILDLLEDGIREAHRKVQEGRVYDAENEKVRIKWIRALAYASNVHRQMQNDRDLEDLESEREKWPDDADPFELYRLAGESWEPIPEDVLGDAWREALEPDDE